MSRGIGLIFRFGLNKIDKLGVFAENLYKDLFRDNQARINKVIGLDAEIPLALSNHKSEVTRIYGEMQGKAGSGNFQDANEQFNVELLPLLDTAVPAAETHLADKQRYTTEFVPLQGEIAATLLDWPGDQAEKLALADGNQQVTDASAQHEYTQAMSAFDSLDVPTLLANAKPVKAKYVTDKVEYEKERTAAKQLLKDLKKHAQHAHAADEINEAETYLVSAKDEADLAHLDNARIEVANAKTTCEDGKDFADEFAKYVVKRAAAQVIITSLQGISDGLDATLVNQQNILNNADADAAPPDRKYVDACNAVDGVFANWRAALKRDHLDARTKPIKDLKDKVKGKPVAAFVDEDLKEIDKRLGLVQSHFNAGAWKKLLMASTGVVSLLTATNKTADRRMLYDAQKTTTEAAVNGLSAHQPVAGRIGAMQLLVTAADNLAGRANMQLEEGIAALKQVAEQCAALVKTSDAAKEYAKERKAADLRFTALGTHVAAANLTEPLATIKAQLEAATKLAEPLNDKNEAVVSGKPDQDFPGARKIVEQAVKDLTAAEALAASLAEATQSQAAAGSAGNQDGVNGAVAELKRQVAAIGKPEADLVADELAQITASLEEATRLAANNQVDVAKVPLQGAADLLVQVKSGLAQHARILAEHKAIDDRLKTLLALTEPNPATIKGKTDPIKTALDEAIKQDEAGEWEKALAELRKAAEAATAAEAAAPLRKKYDKEKADLEVLRTALIDPLKGQVLTTLNEATAEADKFNFAAAQKKLGKADAQIESAKVVTLATTNPDDGAFLVSVQKMLDAEDGGKLVDALVQSLPKSAKTIAAIAKLALARFGIDLATDAGSKKKSVKKLWEMLAKVPTDTVKNPSLKKVERREPTKNGGFYRGSEDLVVMNGRPGQRPQKFGANLVGELPGDVPAICQPTSDDDVDYFDFATLHEVGHAVDDRLRFMESRLDNATFGGWKQYGGNIDEIVAAVGKKSGYNTTPEQLAYISDRILGLSPTPPTAPSNKTQEWADNLQKVEDWYLRATWDQIWWNQTETDAITLDGVVYQEAYKRTWVSYQASERKKAMTGYQFRAPGEWFAELYACYHSGKLKKGHPAEAWLEKITAKT